jgi:2'-5' RNA ligase
MIRTATLALSTETFAAGRKKYLTDTDGQLRPHVKDALLRLGLPGWEGQIVNAALDVFDVTARSEVDEWSQVLDDMRDAFAQELGDALKKTKATANRDAQTDTVTRWVSTMAVNAATEAATTADTSEHVGLEWITMHDDSVRSQHKEAEGQTVPTGQPFTVGGEHMYYPGQPVGDPSNWINCRCVARPTMLEGDSASITASADPQDGDVSTTCVIVALPAENDPVSAASSEADGAHCTLLFLGDCSSLDKAELTKALETFVGKGVTPMTENVSGRGTLGKNSADVVLIDGASLVNIRDGLLNMEPIWTYWEAVEQFPTWVPHVTLGYPETPAAGDFSGESITFDRLALWYGEDRTAIYPLGETMSKTEASVIHAEDEAFTQEVADAAVEVFGGTAGPESVPVPSPDQEQFAEETPWHGVLAPEGTPSGDGRQFAAGALTNRDLPLPLKAMFVDDEGHKGSVIVGRIDNIFRDGNLVKGEGVFDNSPEADKAKGMVERKMWRGVSVDVDAAELSVDVEENDAQVTEFSAARIASATMCAIPAFAEAYVALGTWADAPGNETAPEVSPDAPVDQKMASVSLVASAAPKLSADAFRNPNLTEETPLTVTEDGRVFGHLAGWETCHIGYEVCTTAPPSLTDYAYFLTGQVFTDAGPVAVGQITLGGGHADGQFGIRAAVAHYDNTGNAVADVTVGEDEFGIWFAGQLRDGVSDRDIHTLRATGVSGDWREVRVRGNASMELIAALSVNVPGFPIARSRATYANGRQLSLIGQPVQARKVEVLDSAFVAKLDAYTAMKAREAKVNKLRTQVRADLVASIKSEVQKLGGK